MFSIFKKKYPVSPDFSGIQADMHSHLLPGIDDGSPDTEISLELIAGLTDLGYSSFITTPHIISDMYPNTPETILDAKLDLDKAARTENKELNITAAAEYYLDDYFAELLKSSKPLLTLRYNLVLVEFSFVSLPFNYKQLIFDLQLAGYQPVLAHPERYGYLMNQKEVYDDLRSAGCIFQMNLLSLTGYYGKQPQQQAEYLVKNKFITLLGTDLHHHRHLDALRSAGQLQPVINDLLDSGKLMNPVLNVKREA